MVNNLNSIGLFVIVVVLFSGGRVLADDIVRDWLHRSEVRSPVRPETNCSVDSLHTFDAIHYEVRIDTIDFTAQSISGEVTVHGASEDDNLGGITLHLAQLEIDSVLRGSTLLSYSRAGDSVNITLGKTFHKGEEFDIRIKYHGQPGNEGPGGFGGFWFVRGVAFSMGVGLFTNPPSMARYWFPCYDEPTDKAMFDLYITTDPDMSAVANGELVGIDVVHGFPVYHWRVSQPVSTYLISVSVAAYLKITDPDYSWICYYVYPEDSAKAKTSFQNVNTMMDCFTEKYSPYHFDRFSYVSAPKGDMEHVTCVTHYDALVNGSNTYDWVLAHELAHQWWGDWVTIGDWRDVWLSEGFATYSEALYQEYGWGEAAYHSYVATSFMNYYLNSKELFPIYDPENLWGATTYEKGACVLYMLRHLVGDSLFFQILWTYGEEYGFANAVTADFQRICNEVSGQDLDWFFEEWVYDWGYPVYEYGWEGKGDTAKVLVRQIQTTGPVFTMPVGVKFKTASSDTMLEVWIDKPVQYFQCVLTGPPTDVEFDPENWVLKKTKEVPYAILEGKPDARVAGLHIYPNPFRRVVKISSENREVNSEGMTLQIYDLTGRVVKSFPLIPHSALLATGIFWDGRDASGILLPAGVYFCTFEMDGYRRIEPVTFLK